MSMALFCCPKPDNDLKYKEQEESIWAMPTIMIVHLRHVALIDRDEKYFTVEMLKKWKEDAEREAGNRLIRQETIKKCKFRIRI